MCNLNLGTLNHGTSCLCLTFSLISCHSFLWLLSIASLSFFFYLFSSLSSFRFLSFIYYSFSLACLHVCSSSIALSLFLSRTLSLSVYPSFSLPLFLYSCHFHYPWFSFILSSFPSFVLYIFLLLVLVHRDRLLLFSVLLQGFASSWGPALANINNASAH